MTLLDIHTLDINSLAFLENFADYYCDDDFLQHQYIFKKGAFAITLTIESATGYHSCFYTYEDKILQSNFIHECDFIQTEENTITLKLNKREADYHLNDNYSIVIDTENMTILTHIIDRPT